MFKKLQAKIGEILTNYLEGVDLTMENVSLPVKDGKMDSTGRISVGSITIKGKKVRMDKVEVRKEPLLNRVAQGAGNVYAQIEATYSERVKEPFNSAVAISKEEFYIGKKTEVLKERHEKLLRNISETINKQQKEDLKAATDSANREYEKVLSKAVKEAKEEYATSEAQEDLKAQETSKEGLYRLISAE